MPVKKLPLNLQTFSELISNGYVYVDKTAYLYDLISSGKSYFLSRPRRFGKSLLVSTLEAIFQGKKNLFEGLAISKTSYAWPVYSVIKLDFSLIPRETGQELRIGLCNELYAIALEQGVYLRRAKDPREMLKELVRTMAQKREVVILIDEYDKPILDHIDNLEKAKKCQHVLKSFYEAIKGLDKYCKFIFLTGVSKFTKTSVFSGLNNLNDISESREGALIVGYTKQEIQSYFKDHLIALASSLEISVEQVLDQMKEWYDGYQFSKVGMFEKLYAPLSVMYCLHKNFFDNYWFTTGTPSYLINLLKTKKYDLSTIQNMTEKEVGSSVFGQYDLADVSLDALLYQAGYLTIKSYDRENDVATLVYPNKEIQDSMRSYLLSMELCIEEFEVSPALKKIKQGLRSADIVLIKNAT